MFCAEEAEPNSSSAQTRHVRSTTTTSRAPEPPARSHNGAAASAAATENQAAPSAHTSCKGKLHITAALSIMPLLTTHGTKQNTW